MFLAPIGLYYVEYFTMPLATTSSICLIRPWLHLPYSLTYINDVQSIHRLP